VVTIADVLRHLIAHAPGLSDTNRAEFAGAVDSEYGAPEVPPDQAAAEAAAAREARAARMAELKAELDQAQADQAKDDETRAQRAQAEFLLAAQTAPAPPGDGGQAA
jgi:Skp family chaperone for outer membrane proteins